MKEQLIKIKELTNNISLLYVEDNAGLRGNMQKLLSRVFDNVFLAEDGEDGYTQFIKLKPKILLTDINMPKMNGFKLIKKIKLIDPACKVIVLSAYDEKEHLHLAINLGVFRYIQKPTKTPELLSSIYHALQAINEEENKSLFSNQMSTIFNYQNNIVVMMHEAEFVLCNQRLYEFFGVNDLEDFSKKYKDIGTLLQEHKDFLYSTQEESWYETLIKNPGKLFHTKINNHNNEYRHLILKSREVPEKEGYYILSFDDVTELNLMSIFDSDATKRDLNEKDREAIIALIQVVKNNSSELKIHNFYRGLTIVNSAAVSKIENSQVTLKMPYPQLKAIQRARFMTISSEIFPANVICRSVKEVDMDKQSVRIDDMSFASNNLTDRKYIRLEPEADHSCTLFYKNIKFSGETTIIDISEVSVKIAIDSLPAGIIVGTDVKIAFNLTLNGKMISITTEANVFRIDENIKNYYLVTMYELNAQNMNKIKEYLASRQMALIREFKKLDTNL